MVYPLSTDPPPQRSCPGVVNTAGRVAPLIRINYSWSWGALAGTGRLNAFANYDPTTVGVVVIPARDPESSTALLKGQIYPRSGTKIVSSVSGIYDGGTPTSTYSGGPDGGGV